MEPARTPAVVTFSVWKALFLREAVHRLFGSRAAWVWLLVEPLVHTAIILFIYTVVRVRLVGGINTADWLLAGMLVFFMFRRTGTQAMNAIEANRALFAYRQVKPVDTVLTRAGLEGLLMLIVSITAFGTAGLFGVGTLPSDPLLLMAAFFALWLLGLGFGLATSVASELIPEMAKIIGLTMTPLYFISGVLMPLSQVPAEYRVLLMWNPVANGVEAARQGFSAYYQAAPETSIMYVFGLAIVLIFFGLALHVRFATRLTSE